MSVSDQVAVGDGNDRASGVRLHQIYRLTRDLAAATTVRDVARVVRDLLPGITDAWGAVLALHADRVLPELADEDRNEQPGPWLDLRADERGVLLAAAEGQTRTPSLRGYHPAAAGDHNAVVLPLCRSDDTVLGVLALVQPPHTPAPPSRHLRAVTDQVAQAVVRAGLFEHEHRLAQRLQMNLLPQLDVPAVLQVAARYAPGSDVVAVGGDWYDLFTLPDGRIGLAIGDVAGHGLTEAAIMAQLRNALRAFALTTADPGAVLEHLDRFLATFLPGRIATVCYLVFDPASGLLTWANAGHPPPLLVSARGRTAMLTQHSVLLGASAFAAGSAHSIPVEPGSTLLLYTDGLVERRTEHLDRGLEFLTALVAEVHALEPDMLCRMLVDHRAKEEHADDRALMVIRFRHTPS